MSEVLSLPWKRNTNLSGYHALDLTLEIGDPVGTLTITRIPRTEKLAGNFVAKHNDVRVSDKTWANRAECQAEAERYLYELPIFANGNSQRALIIMRINMGRVAAREGKSIYDNPFKPSEATDRAQWAEGWLQVITADAAAKAINAASATARAMQQLEHDFNFVQAKWTVYRLAIEYALTLDNDDEATKFLALFLADDIEDTNKTFPGWVQFVTDMTGAVLPPTGEGETVQ